jgi:hypothetical protein
LNFLEAIVVQNLPDGIGIAQGRPHVGDVPIKWQEHVDTSMGKSPQGVIVGLLFFVIPRHQPEAPAIKK